MSKKQECLEGLKLNVEIQKKGSLEILAHGDLALRIWRKQRENNSRSSTNE